MMNRGDVVDRLGGVAGVGLLAGLLALTGCPAARPPAARFAGTWQEAAEVWLPSPPGLPGWVVGAGDDVVLVMHSPDGPSGDAPTEELVVEVTPAELTAGTITIEPGGRTARYQQARGALTFASTTVRGRMTLTRDGARVRGRVSLTATAPFVDTDHRQQVSRELAFELEARPAPPAP